MAHQRTKTTAHKMLLTAMKDGRVSKAELARRLGTSRANVTQLLKPNHNWTLDGICIVAKAIGCKVEIRIFSTEKAT